MLRQRFDADARLGLRLTLIVLAAVLVAIPFGLLLLEVVVRGPLTSFDEHVAQHQNSADLHDANRVRAARIVTYLGSTWVLVLVVVVATIYLAVLHRRRRQAVYLVTTVLLGLAVNNIVKNLVGRSRPHFSDPVAHAFGKSFPSGHAMNSTVVYGALLLIAWGPLRTTPRRLAALAFMIVLVLAIATSRVVLGVHYVTDVVAGIVLGAAIVLASASAFRAWQHEGGRLPPAVESAPALTADRQQENLDADRRLIPPSPRFTISCVASLRQCVSGR